MKIAETLQSLTINLSLNAHQDRSRVICTYGVMRLGVHTHTIFLACFILSSLPKVFTRNSKVSRRISNSCITWQCHDPQRAQLEDVLSEIAVHVIRPITRCVGTKQANSAVYA